MVQHNGTLTGSTMLEPNEKFIMQAHKENRVQVSRVGVTSSTRMVIKNR